MKITRRQLRKIISEALKDIKYASRGEDGYEFTSEPPQDSQELYGQTISSGVGDVNTVKDFFKDSLVDVNIIVVPDPVYDRIGSVLMKKMGYEFESTEDFIPAIDSSIFSKGLNWLASKLSGYDKQLNQLRAQMDKDSYNIIIQNKTRPKMSEFLFDLSWITHDLIGHAVNFGYLKPLLYALNALIETFSFGIVPNIAPLSQGGEFERALGVHDGSFQGDTNPPEAVDKIRKSLISDFEKENFTVGVRGFDLGASILGYYFIKKRFPPTIENAIKSGALNKEEVNKIENKLKETFDLLKGKSGLFNFGDLAV